MACTKADDESTRLRLSMKEIEEKRIYLNVEIIIISKLYCRMQIKNWNKNQKFKIIILNWF